MKPKTRFFHFSQNNSGGEFVFDRESGITHHVVIEAIDYNHANARAEEIGLYFNGVDDGRDCACCGDRWSRQRSSDGDRRSTIYGLPITDPKAYSLRWMQPNPEAVLHRLNGKIEWFGKP